MSCDASGGFFRSGCASGSDDVPSGGKIEGVWDLVGTIDLRVAPRVVSCQVYCQAGNC